MISLTVSPSIALLFCTPFLNRLSTGTKSTKTKAIWFFTLPPGEVHVCCAVLFCWNQVFITNKLCFLQKFTSLSPFSFRVPNPYGPMMFHLYYYYISLYIYIYTNCIYIQFPASHPSPTCPLC